MRQHQRKARRYAQAAERFIGRPVIERLVRRSVLDASTVCDAILMGPNARHLARSALLAETEQAAVSFDICLVLARKGCRATRIANDRY
jgi:hypothetical protein